MEELNEVSFTVSEAQAVTQTLRSLLDRKGWLEIDQAIDIACQIATGLDHAHKSGVAHLMLQPEYVLIDDSRSVVISEFGIEMKPDLEWAFSRRSRRCPAQYLSPEQMDDKTFDNRSDLYSLGVIMFEMLTDRLPFDSVEASQIRERRLRQSPMVPYVLFAEIPKGLSAIVMQLLEADPNLRFQNACDVIEALQQLRQSLSKPSVATEQLESAETKPDYSNSAGQESQVTEDAVAVRPLEMQPARVYSKARTQDPASGKQNRVAQYKRSATQTDGATAQTPIKQKSHDSKMPLYATRMTNGTGLSAHSWILIAVLILAIAIATAVLINLGGTHV